MSGRQIRVDGLENIVLAFEGNDRKFDKAESRESLANCSCVVGLRIF